MKILICDTKMIRTIQKQFNEEFPHLKIEFFARKHKPGEASNDEDIIDSNRLLSEFRYKHNTNRIEIDPEMTVNQVEQLFWDGFGLSVQIFRLVGNDWVETTVTDEWTLAKQEEQAKKYDSESEPYDDEIGH